MRKLVSLFAAVVLTLGMAGAALASDSVSVTTVTATVNGVISMTGVPATYNFGAGVGGDRLTGPEFTITVASSDPFTLRVTATDLVATGGTIPAERLNFTSNGTASDYTGPGMLIGVASPITETMALNLLSNTHAGAYTGTVTWTASN